MNIDASQLEAVAAQKLASTQNLAYAFLAPDLTIIAHSESFANYLENPPAQIIGILLPELCVEFLGIESSLVEISTGNLSHLQLDHVYQQQSDSFSRYVSYQIWPCQLDQHTDAFCLLVNDSTKTAVLEQKLMQERNELRLAKAELAQANADLLRLNRLKSIFLAMAAHDLRTPLTVILGYSQLLEAGLSSEVNKRQLEYLTTISSQAEWLDRLITNLLSLDQIEEGLLVLDREECDLNLVVGETLNFMAGMVTSKQQTLQFDSPLTPTPAYVDVNRTQQIVYNLLGNAVKYTPPAGHIIVSLDQDGAESVLTVKDNGRGMSDTEQSHLFELYYRTPGVKQEKIKGTGLGLFIVKSMVDAHNGRIVVESALNAGTAFTIWLPQKPGV
ncbi:MAG: HAMP domain-containing histidine kinase [Anaerolineales bacterium]|nr:HAMP domain-containing histidine kinase [Anaerolineales bacterium]